MCYKDNNTCCKRSQQQVLLIHCNILYCELVLKASFSPPSKEKVKRVCRKKERNVTPFAGLKSCKHTSVRFSRWTFVPGTPTWLADRREHSRTMALVESWRIQIRQELGSISWNFQTLQEMCLEVILKLSSTLLTFVPGFNMFLVEFVFGSCFHRFWNISIEKQVWPVVKSSVRKFLVPDRTWP